MKLHNNNAQEFLSKVTQRLKDEGFHITYNAVYKNQPFDCAAKTTRFEIDKFGFVTTFYLFASFTSLNISLLRGYSTKSFNYAKKASGIHPPRGLLYGIFCFPVAIVDAIDIDTAESIRKKAPSRHWAALEMPVVVGLERRELYYCEITPDWGRIYYDQMRRNIKDLLSL